MFLSFLTFDLAKAPRYNKIKVKESQSQNKTKKWYYELEQQNSGAADGYAREQRHHRNPEE